MIKLVKMIVDPSMRLVGFVAEGMAKDFGEFTRTKVQRPVTMKYLIDTSFTNKQVAISKGVIQEMPGFKLNQLPVLMLDNNNYVEINNEIYIRHRYVQNNENIGFGVEFGDGRTGKYTYMNILKLCDLFKPMNFIIKTNTTGKKFIAGKPGAPLNEIPMTVVGSTTNAKRTKSGAKEVNPVTGDFVNEVDILDLYDFIREANGFIINLPGSKYKATTESSPAAKEFIPFNIGEVGTPWLDFNEKKFNVSCNFKKPGAVALELSPHKMINVITFVYRKKNIFFNGDNYISKLGVVIPMSVEAELLKRFGRSMSFTEINDIGMIQPISMLIAQQNVKFYEVDTSKIGIISNKKYDSLIIPTEYLYRDVVKLTQNKLMMKYLKGTINDLVENGNFTSGVKVKDIAPQFAALGKQELQQLEDNGIDIYTGAYTVKDESTKTSGASTEDIVEVEYAIEGLSSIKLTYAQMLECGPKNPAFLNNLIARVNEESDFEKRGKVCRDIFDKLEKENNELKRKIWLHKCAMYLKNNKAAVHQHDRANWELNTKKRTKAKCYNSTVAGCQGLQLLVLNIDI